MAAAVACGPFMWLYTHHDPLFGLSFPVYATIGSLYVIVLHRANIQRLLKGIEPKIGQKNEDVARTR